jgi:hypothetical protein
MLQKIILILSLSITITSIHAQKVVYTDVLVVGGGAGGTSAGLQSARLGVKTIIAEETTWLGGMLSAAGVTATDGNHRLPSGIWNEFREALYKVYGGPNKVFTGWVSNTQFEPHVADSILKSWATKQQHLTVLFNYVFKKTIVQKNAVKGAVFINQKNNETVTVYAKQTIDATELGDVLASAKIPCSIGMEADAITKENAGVTASNNIVQDITYAAILKDYGIGADKTIPKPNNYSPEEFDGACTNYYNNLSRQKPTVDAQKMLDYGKLPNGKYMINWPGYGNDYYVNLLQLNRVERDAALQLAKEQTYRFIYFIQTTLGFKQLGIADDEFPTADQMPLIAYHRESRRVNGLTRLNINHLAKPFDYKLYRTGIAVGDYPIDHHHKKNPSAPQHLDFKAIPSFNVPLGSLIPKNFTGIIAAEKNISVSNIVNGTTRLQPCVLTTGQATGALAALAVKQKVAANKVDIRLVQETLLNNNAIIMPYIDAGIKHPQFISIQKIGATGILRGNGIATGWANQTWFYPDSSVLTTNFVKNFTPFGKAITSNKEYVTINDAIATIAKNKNLYVTFLHKSSAQLNTLIAALWNTKWQLQNFEPNRAITRAEMAVLLDQTINPFHYKKINHQGDIIL